MSYIRPHSHTDIWAGNQLYYHCVDYDQMPKNCNAVSINWKIPLVLRIKLLFHGKISTSFRSCNIPRLRMDIGFKHYKPRPEEPSSD